MFERTSAIIIGSWKVRVFYQDSVNPVYSVYIRFTWLDNERRRGALRDVCELIGHLNRQLLLTNLRSAAVDDFCVDTLHDDMYTYHNSQYRQKVVSIWKAHAFYEIHLRLCLCMLLWQVWIEPLIGVVKENTTVSYSKSLDIDIVRQQESHSWMLILWEESKKWWHRQHSHFMLRSPTV